MSHFTILIDNNSLKKEFIQTIAKGVFPKELKGFEGRKGLLFSQVAIEEIIEEEAKRDYSILSTVEQRFETMSSGEQKKILLNHLLDQNPDFILLDNPFDNLDIQFQDELKNILRSAGNHIQFIQLISRKNDALSFIKNYARLVKNELQLITASEFHRDCNLTSLNTNQIPASPTNSEILENPLIEFKKVSIAYQEKKVLYNIEWTVKLGDFWQLMGPNGSGKTSLLSMIVGDNPKAFGQEIYLFGRKKGSGESVWAIKEKIGYYSPAMTNKFNGRHTVENMLISGLTDSIGLYTIPTEIQKRIIKEWLTLLGLNTLKDIFFHKLSLGQQRLVMTARAMVKHPPVLILDEPTAGMDDVSANLLVALVNKIAKETRTAIIFVSHRKEPHLQANQIFELNKTPQGSIGLITKQ